MRIRITVWRDPTQNLTCHASIHGWKKGEPRNPVSVDVDENSEHKLKNSESKPENSESIQAPTSILAHPSESSFLMEI